MSREVMETALKQIRQVPAENFRFSISSGEPSLWPCLDDMLEAIAQNFPGGTSVNILSNGSLSLEHIKLAASIAENLKLRFIFTIHPLQSDIEKLIRKLADFQPGERRQLFHLKMVLPPAKAPEYQKALEILSALEKTGLKCSLHAELDFASGRVNQAYKPDELDFIEAANKNAFIQYVHVQGNVSRTVTFPEGIRKDIFHYKGMNCAAGKSSIYLDEKGNVSRGQFCGHAGYSILVKNPFEDPNFYNIRKCPENHCVCMPFTALPKWASEEFAPHWLK